MTAPTAAVATARRPLPGARAVRLRAGDVGLALAWLVIALVVVAVLWPGLLTSQQPDAAPVVDAFYPPGKGGHLLGTDELGRDTLARIIYGARPSMVIGVGSTAIGLVVGSLLGVLSATAGRAVDAVVMWATDVLLAFPGLLLALMVIASLGPGVTDAVIALAISAVPGFVRIARAQAIVVREADYVRAAVVLGKRRSLIQLRHVLPNALPPLLLFAMISVGTAIIAGSTLSFLGLGPQPPTPEWGAMLSSSRDYLAVAWAPAVFPGLAITLTVLAVNVAGRDLRRRFEGRRVVRHD